MPFIVPARRLLLVACVALLVACSSDETWHATLDAGSDSTRAEITIIATSQLGAQITGISSDAKRRIRGL